MRRNPLPSSEESPGQGLDRRRKAGIVMSLAAYQLFLFWRGQNSGAEGTCQREKF
jgi:hypothetical protein